LGAVIQGYRILTFTAPQAAENQLNFSAYRRKVIKIIDLINFFLHFTGFVIDSYRDSKTP